MAERGSGAGRRGPPRRGRSSACGMHRGSCSMLNTTWTRGLMKSVLASLGTAALALVAHDASAQQVVNYGVQPATMPIYIARELGLLDSIEKKHNVKIVFRNFAYGAPENQAMGAGRPPSAWAGKGPAIIGV